MSDIDVHGTLFMWLFYGSQDAELCALNMFVLWVMFDRAYLAFVSADGSHWQENKVADT